MADDDDDEPKEECKKGAPEYMLTYGDMMTLLLCFFVLLLSMSSQDPKRFMEVADSMHDAFSGVLPSHSAVPVNTVPLRSKAGGKDARVTTAQEALKKLQQIIRQNGLTQSVDATAQPSGILIRIFDPIGFKEGSDKLTPECLIILNDVLSVLREIPNRATRVEGHTDNQPINTPRFPTNWELSASRAIAVIKFFHSTGEDPARLTAVGRGEYLPIAPNTRDEFRARNRRIEIYVDFPQERLPATPAAPVAQPPDLDTTPQEESVDLFQ